jgi:hypothetical protein
VLKAFLSTNYTNQTQMQLSPTSRPHDCTTARGRFGSCSSLTVMRSDYLTPIECVFICVALVSFVDKNLILNLKDHIT